MSGTPDHESLFYKRNLNAKAPVKSGLSIANVLELICQLLIQPVGYLYSHVANGVRQKTLATWWPRGGECGHRVEIKQEGQDQKGDHQPLYIFLNQHRTRTSMNELYPIFSPSFHL